MKSAAAFLLLFLFSTPIGCGDSHEILRCDNIYKTTTNHKHPTGFAQLGRQLVEDCGGCHSSEEPVFGYDFSPLQTAYESARDKVEFIYPQLVSGDMPKYSDPYDAEKLKSFRTWYCNGALYE